MILLSAFVAMIPDVPVISLLVGVQVVNGLLLPINLFFIWRLSRSRSVMGERRSRGLLDGAAGVTVGVTSTAVARARRDHLRGHLSERSRSTRATLRRTPALRRDRCSSSSDAPIAPPRSPSAATCTGGGR